MASYATDLSLCNYNAFVFGVTLKLLVINILPSFPAINKHRCLLPAMCHNLLHHIDNTWPVAALIVRNETRYSLRITIFAYPTCIWHPRYGGGGFPSEYCYAVWYGKKLEWCGFLLFKKFEDIFIRFDRMYERDRHMDRQTLHDDIGCTCIASHSKNFTILAIFSLDNTL